MRQFGSKIWDFFGRRGRSQKVRKRPRTRLVVELLEDRSVPSANASGVLTGFAFIDANGNGAFDAQEATVPGASVTLTGTTDQGAPINIIATTDTGGSFTFQNILPGTYQLTASPVTGLLDGGVSIGGVSTPQGVTIVSSLPVSGGQTINEDVGYGGLDPNYISLRQFLTSTTTADFPFAAAGNGTALANFRSNNSPIVKTAIGDVSVPKNSPDTIIDLAGHFSDPDITNSQVRIDTNFGPINVELFDTTAPQTVANFFNYALSNRYNNSIFHRLATGFVLQGGGFTYQSNPSQLNAISTDPPVQNEFGASNTQYTVAMAKSPGNPNSATSQFFFNLADNSSNLDNQNGGFTVFGKLVGPADQAALNQLTDTSSGSTVTVKDESSTNSAFNTIPLVNYSGSNFPTDTTAANYEMINDVTVVRRDEWLTYSVVSNTNQALVTTSLDNNHLTLHYTPDMSGSATITVRATDRYGASVDATFNVNVSTDQAPIASVVLTPTSPTKDDTMTATVTASDPENDPLTFTYVWKVDGTVVQTTPSTSSITDTLDLTTVSSVKSGSTVSVEVTPNDGQFDGQVGTDFKTIA